MVVQAAERHSSFWKPGGARAGRVTLTSHAIPPSPCLYRGDGIKAVLAVGLMRGARERVYGEHVCGQAVYSGGGGRGYSRGPLRSNSSHSQTCVRHQLRSGDAGGPRSCSHGAQRWASSTARCPLRRQLLERLRAMTGVGGGD